MSVENTVCPNKNFFHIFYGKNNSITLGKFLTSPCISITLFLFYPPKKSSHTLQENSEIPFPRISFHKKLHKVREISSFASNASTQKMKYSKCFLEILAPTTESTTKYHFHHNPKTQRNLEKKPFIDLCCLGSYMGPLLYVSFHVRYCPI